MGIKITVAIGPCSESQYAALSAQLPGVDLIPRSELKDWRELQNFAGYLSASTASDPQELQWLDDISQHLPWLPVISQNACQEVVTQQALMLRCGALQQLNQLISERLNAGALIAFHSRYKLVLLAHSQPAYREIGPFVAQIHQWSDLTEFAVAYRLRLMALLAHTPSRANHTNALMHIQGYFRPYLDSEQRQALAQLIEQYRLGEQPLAQPIAALKAYLQRYPNAYLSQQHYFDVFYV